MVLRVEDFRRIDINYRYFHGNLGDLMEKAGNAVATTIGTKYGVGNRILVLCGSGNKAGDGLVAAEKLRNDNTVTVILAKGRESIRKAEALSALEKYGGTFSDSEKIERELKKADIVIDALLGTGTAGVPRAPYDGIIKMINESKTRKVSIDLPSGFLSPLAVMPEITVTFHDMKEGMNKENSGEIEVVDIGIPPDTSLLSGPGDFASLRLPKEGSHKGMNGVLGIIGGWTYHGSAIISAMAAMGTGQDLVNLIVPQHRYDLMASFSPELIIRPFTGLDRLSEDLKRFDALVIGPGIGEDKELKKILLKVIAMLDIPAVIDAEAIKMLKGEDELIMNRELVFTPHALEFEIFTGTTATEENLLEFCQREGVVVVLKGKTDLISDGREVYRTDGGNARLTMGGTGDLLTGVIGGLLAKGMGLVESARLGTFIVKKAASTLFEDKAYWYSVHDLIDEIPYTMKELWEYCNE